jgi:hypothetical protein
VPQRDKTPIAAAWAHLNYIELPWNRMCRNVCSGEWAAAMPSAGALSKTDHLFSVSHRQHFESCMIARLSTRGLLVRFNQQ